MVGPEAKGVSYKNKIFYISKQILYLGTLSMNFIYSGIAILLSLGIFVLLLNSPFYTRGLPVPTCYGYIIYFLIAVVASYVLDFVVTYFSLIMFLNLFAFTQKESPLYPFRKSRSYISHIATWMLVFTIFIRIPSFLISSTGSDISCLLLQTGLINLPAKLIIPVPPLVFQSFITFIIPLLFFYKIGPADALKVIVRRLATANKQQKKAQRRLLSSVIGVVLRFLEHNKYNIIVLLTIYYLPQIIALEVRESLPYPTSYIVLVLLIIFWLPFISAYSFVASKGAGALSIFAHAEKKPKAKES